MPLLFPTADDRLEARERPAGIPLLQQTWENVLFLHWIVPKAALQALLPEQLAVDTHEHRAWVGIVPISNCEVRPGPMPPFPWPMEYKQINLRTYVHYDDVPGLWFFSLDANNDLAVQAARALFHLPYRKAQVSCSQSAGLRRYQSRRLEDPKPATLRVSYALGDPLSDAEDPRSLEFFLTERYWAFTADEEGKLYKTRVHHEAWRLRSATIDSFSSSLVRRAGLPVPDSNPMVLAANPVHAQIWAPEEA